MASFKYLLNFQYCMYKYNAQIMPIKTKTVGQNDSKRARERKRNFKGNKRVHIIKVWYMISGSSS